MMCGTMEPWIRCTQQSERYLERQNRFWTRRRCRRRRRQERQAGSSSRTMTSGSQETEAIVRFLASASRSWIRACRRVRG